MSVSPALPLRSYVILGKLPNLSGTWFPYLINEYVLMHVQGTMHIKCTVWHKGFNKWLLIGINIIIAYTVAQFQSS